MTHLIVRPSMKKVWLGYVVCALLFLAAGGAYALYPGAGWPVWVVALPLLLFIWPLTLHVQRAFTTLTVTDGKLRYQTGMLSRSTRTMELSRLQDVRVNQTFGQRLMNVGSISLETAGESSGLTMDSIDSPQKRADAILDAARGRDPVTGL